MLKTLTSPVDGTLAQCDNFVSDLSKDGLKPVVGGRKVLKDCVGKAVFLSFLPHGVAIDDSGGGDCIAYLLVGDEVGGKGSGGWFSGTLDVWVEEVDGQWKVDDVVFSGHSCFCSQLARRPRWTP